MANSPLGRKSYVPTRLINSTRRPRGAGKRLPAPAAPLPAAQGETLGAPYTSQLQAATLVTDGLAVESITYLQQSTGLTLERIKQLARISEGTLSRRRAAGRLSPDESERLLRLSRTIELAFQLFNGDRAAALAWLDSPIPALANQTPLRLAATEPGAREVEDLIGRIEHGVVS